MNLFDTLTWAEILEKTTFLGTPTLNYKQKKPVSDRVKLTKLPLIRRSTNFGNSED
jgi:hypothetical protein